MATLGELGEGGLIRLAKRHAGHLPPAAIGIGDDAALLPGNGPTLAAVDLLVEGVHFRRETLGGADALGWKALAVNLSDIAAMGGTPTAALLGLALPAGLPQAFVADFFRGFEALAQRHGVWLAGGDTTGSPGPIMISLTILGRPGPRTLTRTAARAGDLVFMSGTPGLAAAGLALLEGATELAARLAGPDQAAGLARARAAHRTPVPQVATGQALAALETRLALLDDSDGLARTAQLLAVASGVDVVLEAEALTPDPLVAAIARACGASAHDWVLYGGEDYQLVGTCAPADWPAVREALARCETPGRRVGHVRPCAHPTAPRALYAPAQGPAEVLAGEAGYAHFARASFPPG